MRTRGAEVVGGRWGRSLFAGGLSKSSSADGVAVLLYCAALGFSGHAARSNRGLRVRCPAFPHAHQRPLVQVTVRRVPPWTVLDAGELQLKLQLRFPPESGRLRGHSGRETTFLLRRPVIRPTRRDRSLVGYISAVGTIAGPAGLAVRDLPQRGPQPTLERAFRRDRVAGRRRSAAARSDPLEPPAAHGRTPDLLARPVPRHAALAVRDGVV
jgi:hypothetical protein